MNNLDYRDPYISLTWVVEDAIVAAGHDCRPVLFSGSRLPGRPLARLMIPQHPSRPSVGVVELQGRRP
jgi:hypothetical protein